MNDAEALREAVIALKAGIGRGGLTYISERLGMSPSAMRKRLESPSAGFDEPTMRAVLLIAGHKSEKFKDYEIIRATRCGSYVIEIRDVKGEEVPCWRLADA